MSPYRDDVRRGQPSSSLIEDQRQKVAKLEQDVKNLWSSLEREASLSAVPTAQAGSLSHDKERISAGKAGLVRELDEALEKWMAGLKELARML